MASTTETDQNLLSKVQENDAQAFEMLLERYRDSIYRHIVRIVRDADASLDLVQEVFLRVWTKADQWDGRGSSKAWLFKMASNLALNLLRSQRRRREQPLDLPAEFDSQENAYSAPSWMIDESAIDPENALEMVERRKLIQSMVDRLPEEKREVVRMVYDAEMDIAETAEALGIPQGTVRSRLHYARKHLAQECKNLGTEWEDIL